MKNTGSWSAGIFSIFLYVITTEHVGRAMLKAAKLGYPRTVLENRDIEKLGIERFNTLYR